MDALSVEKLAAELDEHGEKAFRRNYHHPFLVVDRTPSEDKQAEFKTVEGDAPDLAKQQDDGDDPKVIPLIKTNRNAYKSKITLGRAKNNDIIIRVSRISKLHAAILLKKNGFELIDMGSANGTAVNGLRLERGQGTEIKSGDKISLWRYEFQFLDIDEFLSFLRRSG